jgi:hypothetical protein
MKLIGEAQTYRDVLDDFVHERLSAAEFLARFFHLWRCDSVARIEAAATVPMSHDAAVQYGGLDSIHALCEDYARSLPDGCGYRVSERQFRLNVQALARSHRLL